MKIKVTLIMLLMALISCHNKKKVVSKVVFSNEYKIDSNTVKKHLYTLASDKMEGEGLELLV